jgi:hypothetical protein
LVELLGKDYQTDFHVLLDFLNQKQGEYIENGKLKKFVLINKIMTQVLHYEDQSGLIIGSVESLLGLSSQIVFGMDAKFNVTKYNELKLITVVYQNVQTRKIVLGCVGFLPGSESCW